MQETYDAAVPVSDAVRYLAFSRWVRQVLIAAREERGWTDKDLEKATGLGPRTWHRWQGNDFGPKGPQVDSINKFCDGLGIPRSVPYKILGLTGEYPIVTPPEPEIPADVREILRRLRDPNFPDAEKFHIKATLAALVARPRALVGAAAKGGSKG